MGEYAMYKGSEVKIGTCECMYYLRWEQRYDVKPIPGNVNPSFDIESIWFRAPRKSEDGYEPGEFPFEGSCGVKPIRFRIKDTGLYKELGEIAVEQKGISQVRDDKTGVCCNVPCGHGYLVDLPQKMFYSGLVTDVLGIAGVGMRNGHAAALIGCVACGTVFARMGLDELVKYCEPFETEKEDWEYAMKQLMEIEASNYMWNRDRYLRAVASGRRIR